ncbi:MAG: hypothetical protein QM756_18175 [Polyangiaceae bacterium]
MAGWFQSTQARTASLSLFLSAHAAIAQTAPPPAAAPAAPVPAAATPATAAPATAAPSVQTAPASPAQTAAPPPATVAVPVPPPATVPSAPSVVRAPPVRDLPRDGILGVRCLGACERGFREGKYRVLIEPTASISGGLKVMNIDAAGGYRVEGVPRDRRASGLLLTSAGIVLTALGAGMALGGGAFRSPLSAREERWFWGGMLTLGVGATMIPLGVSRASRNPRLVPLEVARPLPLAGMDDAVPLKYREPVLEENQAPPAGSTTVDEPRWGLVTAGAITLAASYGIMAAIAVGQAANDPNADSLAALAIPLIGPVIVDRREGAGGALSVFGTGPQLAGAVMLLVGATSARRVLVRTPSSLAVTPIVNKGVGGVGLSGAF